jgi:hypothetical protein
MWLTSLAIGPLWHSQAEAEASGHAVACECSSPTLPVSDLPVPADPWGMAVVVVEAFSSELSLVVLSFMFMLHEAPGGSEQCHSICWCDMHGGPM